MNYCDLLFSTENRYLDLDALIDSENNKRLTYRQLKSEVIKYSSFLLNKGLKSKDIVSLHIYNSNEVAILILAIQYIGCVTCLIDPLFKANELDYYLVDSDTKLLITHLDKDIINTSSNSAIININEFSNINEVDINLECYNFDIDELSMILYTSGSTSTPKGVMYSNECFEVFLKKSLESFYVYNENDRLLCFVPFSHAYGPISIMIPALYGKAAMVFMRSFQPMKIGNLINTENITHIFGVPTHYQQLLRYENLYESFKKLKRAFCAASPLSYDVTKKWLDITSIYLDEGFGLSESSTLISTRLNMLPVPAGNVGYSPSFYKVDAINENGEVCKCGEIGELRVFGEGFMMGYYKREKETNERLKDGYLLTGDYGYIREDGSIVICGRKTEFINVSGLKISPIEIEAVLNSHNDVYESAVVGIEDSLYGEIIKAFVVLKNNNNILERELIRYVAERIANFKVPKSIVFLNELPRNNIGKIDKNTLKRL